MPFNNSVALDKLFLYALAYCDIFAYRGNDKVKLESRFGDSCYTQDAEVGGVHEFEIIWAAQLVPGQPELHCEECDHVFKKNSS